MNVRLDEVPEALRVLRAAAASVRPFTLRLGPPSTFLPDTPTLHLAVGGRGDATTVLRHVRDAVFRPPLERSLTFGFVPHVTLSDDMHPDRIAALIAALSGFVVETTFDRVHLLQEQRHGEVHRRWVPIADAPFAPPIVVGRGGVELHLAVTRLVDPEAVDFETGSWPDDEPRIDVPRLVRRAPRLRAGGGHRPATGCGGGSGTRGGAVRVSRSCGHCWWPPTNGVRASPGSWSPPSSTPQRAWGRA